jgi:hypothetical protein
MCAVSFVFFACGIEDYIYLEPIPASSVTQSNNMVIIRLPQVGNMYFSNFAIFYRIYISGVLLEAVAPDQYSTLNPSLFSDYNAFLPYTNIATNTTVNTGAVGTLFKNRNYWKLEVEGTNIDGVLAGNGQTVRVDFQEVIGRAPTLERGGTQYVLWRSNGEGTFTPVPDRRFMDTAALNSTNNATALVNADVAPVSGSSSGNYAYAAMYIVAMGNDNNFSPIYSSPTFLGVFRLPLPN